MKYIKTRTMIQGAETNWKIVLQFGKVDAARTARPLPTGQVNIIPTPYTTFHFPVASSTLHTKATVKLAIADTPTSHHMMVKEEKEGMKEVTIPLMRVRRENKRMEIFLPQTSDTSPARNVPTPKPE